MENDTDRHSCIDYIEVRIVDHDNSMDMHNMHFHKDWHIDHHCNTYKKKDDSS